MKILGQLARLGVFLVLALLMGFIIIAVDVVAIPLMLNYPNDYAGGVSFPAMMIVVLSVAILFKKVVLKKAIKGLLVALTFYVICNTVAVLMMAIGEPDLAPAFAWTGVIGIAAGFIISKAKKNSSV